MKLQAHWVPERYQSLWQSGNGRDETYRLEKLLAKFKRSAHEAFDSLTTDSIVEALDRALARWQEDPSPWLEDCLRNLSNKTGWSLSMLKSGLQDMLTSWREPNMTNLLELDLGHPLGLDRPDSAERFFVRGPESIMVHLAGNVPTLGIPELIRSFLVKAPLVMRLPSIETITLPLFIQTLKEIEPRLVECVLLLHWPKEAKEYFRTVYRLSEDIVFYGGIQARQELLPLVPATATWHEHGSRVSLGWVEMDEGTEDPQEFLRDTAFHAARQVALYDQLGCLSPQVIYVREDGTGRALHFAEELSKAMAEYERLWPRRRLSMQEAQQIQTVRQKAFFRSLNNQPEKQVLTRIWQSKSSTAWTVVYTSHVEFELSPGNRFVYVKQLPRWESLQPILRGWRGYLSTLGVAGSLKPQMVQGLTQMGFSRICPLNEMQNPRSTWRHDGGPTLARLLHYASWES